MEEAQGWLLLVEEGERRCLAVWALAAARDIPSQGAASAPLVTHHVLPQGRRWRGAHCRHPGRAGVAVR